MLVINLKHVRTSIQFYVCLLLYIVQISFQVALSIYFYLTLIYLYLQQVDSQKIGLTVMVICMMVIL